MKEDALRKILDDYFDAHVEEYLADLAALIAISSERGEEKPDRPFGDGPYQALQSALSLAEKYGFSTDCVDNCVGYAQYPQTSDHERQLDILAHLDVVPAGDGWTKTAPFVMKRDGDILYGRGTSDDKGPALAALYAMRALKESGIELERPVRLVLGTDEECGSADLPHYFDKIPEAPYTFTPDSDYPLVNVEKGRFVGEILGRFEEDGNLPRVLRIDSGFVTNVIPSKADAVLEGVDFSMAATVAAKAESLTGVRFHLIQEGDKVIVHAEGVQGHAASPDKANNALTGLLAFLNAMDFSYSDGQKMINALAHLFPHGDWQGRAAGVAMSDEVSGDLTMSLNILHYTPDCLRAAFDSRVCASATKERLDMVRLNLESYGMKLESSFSSPHIVPEDSYFVRTLLDCYELFSGKEGHGISTGGGTYVHNLKNGVAFGCAVDGFDNKMHGADEQASLGVLMMSGKIFAMAIAKLCGVKD